MNPTRRSVLSAAIAMPTLAAARPVLAQAPFAVPAFYPADYAAMVEAARKEGRVSIYTSTDSAQAQGLLEAFKAAHPMIVVDWNDLGTNGSFNRVISEAAANQVGSDLVWTSAMDQLLSLVERGLTQPYRSPEIVHLPAWASYRDHAYGTTVEPAAVLFNKTLMPENTVPKSHAELLAMLRDRRTELRGKVGTFDPEKSGTGFLYHTAVQRNVPEFWEIIKAFGAAGGKVYSSSGQMREKAVSGEHALLFNVIGSYAMEWVRHSQNIGVAFLADYVPAFSRVAIIPKGAPHPNAGKIFLDFMLSLAGQKLMSERQVPSVRSDVEGPMSLGGITRLVGGKLQVIPVNAETASYLETRTRVEFIREWRRALQG
ncbi:MAG: ABC transporter substrate-binding protein [Acetobacteraceae bacterium]|nr:ABC transporter substrate-binding protein [Acetobacteraceae bacterium]